MTDNNPVGNENKSWFYLRLKKNPKKTLRASHVASHYILQLDGGWVVKMCCDFFFPRCFRLVCFVLPLNFSESFLLHVIEVSIPTPKPNAFPFTHARHVWNAVFDVSPIMPGGTTALSVELHIQCHRGRRLDGFWGWSRDGNTLSFGYDGWSSEQCGWRWMVACDQQAWGCRKSSRKCMLHLSPVLSNRIFLNSFCIFDLMCASAVLRGSDEWGNRWIFKAISKKSLSKGASLFH